MSYFYLIDKRTGRAVDCASTMSELEASRAIKSATPAYTRDDLEIVSEETWRSMQTEQGEQPS